MSLSRKWSLCVSFVLAAAVVSFAHPVAAQGSPVKAATGFVSIDGARALYVDYIQAAPGRPTVVLLNGLTYSTGTWEKFVEQLKGDGLGILRYDMTGQGRTLLRYAPILTEIPLNTQVEDLKLLLDTLGLTERVHLVSLSYGGSVAVPFSTRWPERVASNIMMAPYVERLRDQDTWIKMQIQNARLMFPGNPASYDDLYDYFLKMIIYSTYPAAEPVVLENPYKLEATFRLVQGARKYVAKDYVGKLPAGKLHLMVASQDQYVPNEVHEEFWNQVPFYARASRLIIDGSEHKIPEDIPVFSAFWVKRIVNGDPDLKVGRSFLGRAKTGAVSPL